MNYRNVSTRKRDKSDTIYHLLDGLITMTQPQVNRPPICLPFDQWKWEKLARFLRSNNFVHLPREKVDSGRTLGRTKSADKKRVKRYFKRDVTNSLLFCFELQRYATARPAGSPVTNSIAQQSAAFESDRYQIRQMVEMSQISPTFGTFTKYLSNSETFWSKNIK